MDITGIFLSINKSKEKKRNQTLDILNFLWYADNTSADTLFRGLFIIRAEGGTKTGPLSLLSKRISEYERAILNKARFIVSSIKEYPASVFIFKQKFFMYVVHKNFKSN